MFGSLDGVIDDVKVTQNLQVLTALVCMICNIESLLLEAENDDRYSGPLRLDLSTLLIPSLRLCSFWSMPC